jgi:hypothetical protein
MRHTERIYLEDDTLTILKKISEGNIGAITILMRLLKCYDKIDPDAAFGSITPMLSLDARGIYGSKIWVLYKDVCDENLVNMIGVLRAVQLGILHPDILNRAIDGSTSVLEAVELDVPGLLAKVRAQLPNFGKVTEEALEG